MLSKYACDGIVVLADVLNHLHSIPNTTHILVHRGALQGSSTQEHTEIVDFFRQATSGIHLTTKGISRQTEADVQFHFYCLHFLIPSLTALFRHLGVNKAGRYIIGRWRGYSAVIYAVALAVASIGYCACIVSCGKGASSCRRQREGMQFT